MGPTWYHQLTGATGPGTMETLLRDFLGFQFVTNNTSTSALSFTQYTRQDFEREAFSQSSSYSPKVVYMLIDDDMINNPNGTGLTFLPNHWVELLPNTYSFDSNTNTMTFKIFTWGGTRWITIGETNFNKYFYGTVTGVK